MGYFTKINNDGYSVTIEVMEGKTPYIGSNGNWWIDGKDTGKPSFGTAPTVSEDGYWIIDGEVTQYRAIGQDGKGITSITKTNTVGIVDTYTINYSDGTISTFDVTNGDKGEQGISPTIGNNGNWWVGDYDTGVKAQGIQGEDGRGIVSVIETSVSGTVHTFTVTYTDGTTSNFDIDIPNSGGGGGSNPDNEYISLDSLNKLTFANKVAGYDADEQKIVYVKKDAILDSVFFSANTKYVLKFKHNLGGISLILPPNVTLEFQGGRLENGGIVGDNTKIIASPYLIFKDIVISKSGTWNIEKAYSHWFNCAKDGYIIDYKTMLEYFYDNIETGVTTVQEPITNPLPLVSRNTTTGKWKIGNTDTNLRYLLAQSIPTLKVANDGVTYLFDNYEKMQYIYNGVRYDVGNLTGTPYQDGTFVTRKPDGSAFTDDTYQLNQLMNLRAKTSVIGDEGDIFMVKPIIGNLDYTNLYDDSQGVVIHNVNGRTIELNGILKCIPNNLGAYHVLVGNDCKELTIKGSGGIHGDIQEHMYIVEDATDVWYDYGEAGMCLHVAGCERLLVKDLEFHNAWGDGIFPSWNRIYGGTNDTDFMKFINNDIACCRRTGIGYEKGDYAEFRQNKFSGHRNRRGIATFAGIDIEPFNYDDTPIRYCRNLIFDNNTFSEFRYWAALRLERCIGAEVTNNYFTKNNGDIQLLQCYIATEDVTATIPLGRDRKFVFGGVVVKNNISEDSKVFMSSYSNGIDYTNKLYMSDNIIKNVDVFVGNIHLSEATIERNTIFGLNQNLLANVNGEYVTISNTLIKHYTNPLQGVNNVILSIWGMFGTTNSFVIGGSIDNLTLNNIILKDLSPTESGKYLTDGYFMPNGEGTFLTREIIDTRMSTTANIFNSFRCKKLTINKFPTDTINFDVNGILSPNCVVDVLEYSNEYDYKDLLVIEKLLAGDVVKLNEQRGKVVKGAFINPPIHSKLFIPNVTPSFTLLPQTPIYNENFTKYVLKNEEHGLSYYVDTTLDIFNTTDPLVLRSIARLDVGQPLISWEDVGVTENITNVTLYNSKGRKVLETTTNVVYEHDGTRFNVMDNISVGLTAERPLKATTKDGFRYYDTELEIEYVYKKSIDDWIAIP